MSMELARAISSGIKLLESLDRIEDLPGRLEIFSDHQRRHRVAQKASDHYLRALAWGQSQAWN